MISVQKTSDLLTPKSGSQKPLFAGLSEGDFRRVFLTPLASYGNSSDTMLININIVRLHRDVLPEVRSKNKKG